MTRFSRVVARGAVCALVAALLTAPGSAASAVEPDGPPPADGVTGGPQHAERWDSPNNPPEGRPQADQEPSGPGIGALSSVSAAALGSFGLNSSGGLSELGPLFDPAVHYYQVITSGTTLTLDPDPQEDGASVAVTKAGAPVAAAPGGEFAVTLAPGRNDIVVTVTASGNSTEVYHLAAWFGAAPTPTIVGISGATSSVYGGTRVTATLKDGYVPVNGSCYSPRFYIGDRDAWVYRQFLDPNTGLTTAIMDVPAAAGYTPGKADLRVSVYCSTAGYWGMESRAVAKDAVTYTAGITVSGIDVSGPLTAGAHFTVRGTNLTVETELGYWLIDETKQKVLYPWWWDYSGDDNAIYFFDYPDGDEEEYAGAGKRTLVVGTCPESWDSYEECTPIYSKQVDWVPPAPADLSFSPSAGSLAGGTKIRLKGRFLESGYMDLTLTVGGQKVEDWDTVQQADDANYYQEWSTGYDIIEFETPPNPTPGPVRIVASNYYGTATARGTFTYAARPTLSTLAPAAVASSGGSTITLTGAGFGTTGKPTVIIGGVKSPYVNRISDTKATAVVPALPAGPADVQVSSSQGGGISEPQSLTITAPGTAPTISTLTPATAATGAEVTVTGTNFGATGTSGVSVGGVWARIVSSTATAITFEVPSLDAAGPADVAVGTVTGLATRAAGLTVTAEPGIASVSPSAIPSYATGNAAKVTLTGAGFGTSGTVKVGAANAVPYTATGGGTAISGVTVPTGTAGSLTVTVTPSGSATPLKGTVRVTGPAVTYLGTDPYQSIYRPASPDSWPSGGTLESTPGGGRRALLRGTGFGSAGTITVGGTTATVNAWSGTEIAFTAPAHAAGDAPVIVTPTGSTLSATAYRPIRYAGVTARPSIVSIASTVDLSHDNRGQFDQKTDIDDRFTLTGVNLTGGTPATTRVIVSDRDGENPITLTPTNLTATSLTFTAPRSFPATGWKRVSVVTDAGQAFANNGIEYLGEGISITRSPDYGLCLRTSQTATGATVHQPAVVTITNNGQLFGASGTVTIDGVTVNSVTYATGQVSFDLKNLAGDLPNPWGAKTIVITPADGGKPVQRIAFTCAVGASVQTTANAGTSPLIIPAGATYTIGHTTTGVLNTDTYTVQNPAGYEYVTQTALGQSGWATAKQGKPAAAGSYYVRVAPSRASVAEHYAGLNAPEPVQVTITGTAITLTPVSKRGASFVYRGQLGDGAGGSPEDFDVTASVTTDPITGVVWEYRNSSCAAAPDNQYWAEGLPKNVARGVPGCGGDPATVTGWDVRVKSFTMNTSGTDRAVFYTATRPTTSITITPRNATVGTVRADRIYDGTTAATFGELSLTGLLDGDNVSLKGDSGGGTFDSPDAGTNKPVTLAGDVELSGPDAVSYTLTNPRPAVQGTISKATALLGLTLNRSSVLLSGDKDVEVTTTVTDLRTGKAPVDGAGLPDVQLGVADPAVCTITGTTVTAKTAGTCVVTAKLAASTNYNAGRAVSDPVSLTETAEIAVFAAPQTISVVADDLTIPITDDVNPTAQYTGLFDGDDISGVEYDYYQGSSKLGGVPTDAGTYKVVPKGGTLTAANQNAYSNPAEFRYVAGSLVLTPVPPSISALSPGYGPLAGTKITVTGSLLDTVKTVRIGDVTLRAPAFTVNDDGTKLTFTAPATNASKTVAVTLVAGTAEKAETFSYIDPAKPEPEPNPLEPQPEPQPSPTVSPTPPVVVPPVDNPSPTPTPSPSVSPSPSPSVSPSPNPSPTTSPTSGPTPAPTTTPVPVPTTTPGPAPTTDDNVRLNLDLKISVDTELVGAQAGLSGGGLKAGSTYVLTMYSQPVQLATGTTDGKGDFTTIITMPKKACVTGGLHELVLSGTSPSGQIVKDSSWIVLNDTCTVKGVTTLKPTNNNNAVEIESFIFPYQSAVLRPKAKRSLRDLATSLDGAKAIIITGYTQTEQQSKAAKRANKRLALRRAKAVRKFLRSLGITTPIVVIGAGGVNPVDKRKQKRNRRVVITVRF